MTMKRIIPACVIGIAMCLLVSCNEKPKHYTMIQNMSDGKQITEQIDAKNDTDALNLYLDRMTKLIVSNIENADSTGAKIESMFVISPDGDTLNTNKELMQAVEMQVLKKAVMPTAP